MPRIPLLVDKRVVRPAETAAALDLVSDMDLLRLKAIARLHARGLPPDVGWDDLLQEALTRVLVGTRRQPEGVTMVAFLAGIMRSLKSGHWRRALGRAGSHAAARIDLASDESHAVELRDPTPDPERSLDPGGTDMRSKVKATSPEAKLARILEALEQELIDTSDEEIMAAARGLGMDPRMRESAAFAGVKYPATWQLSDFFEFDECRRLADLLGYVPNSVQADAKQRGAVWTPLKRKARQRSRSETPKSGRDSGDK